MVVNYVTRRLSRRYGYHIDDDTSAGNNAIGYQAWRTVVTTPRFG